MNTKEILLDSLHYPFTSTKNSFILFILFVATSCMGVIPVLINSQAQIPSTILAIILSIFTSGYLIRIIKSTLEDSAEMPAFNEWGKMGEDGIRFIIVTLAYYIPLIPLIMFDMFYIPLNPTSVPNYYILLFSFIMSFIATFLLSVLTFMALGNMVHEKTIKGAFQFREILKLIKSVRWQSYLTYALIYTLIDSLLYLIRDFAGYDFSVYGDLQIIAILLFSGAIGTYLLAFQGRLIGSIFCLSQEKENND